MKGRNSDDGNPKVEYEAVLDYNSKVSYKEMQNFLSILIQPKYNHLQSLLLSHNNLIDDDISQILQFLPITVTNLNLQDNKITCQGVTEICDIIHREKIPLYELDLSCNLIEDKGAEKIMQLLASTAPITRIFLNSNKITDQGVTLILNAAVEKSPPISYINLCYNNLSDEFCRRYRDQAKAFNVTL